jgi:prepilin-type N-terminal cleavage/methylation domain-containing protein/prepilin-type processing-associated H-X9-DG protein
MRRTAFTLLELLVVIAVIVLLISLLHSALRMCRMQADSLKCLSNVKALTVDLFAYAEHNDDTFPRGYRVAFPGPGEHLGGASGDELGRWWIDEISEFAERDDSQKRVFHCPSKQIDNLRLQDNILWGNYGLNRSICRTWPASRLQKGEFTGAPLGRNSVPHPSQTLLIVDSGQPLITWWDVTDSPPSALTSLNQVLNYLPGLDINTGKNLLLGQRWDAIMGRHPKKTVNAGYIDGHADRKKAQELSVESTADGCKNLSPTWVPE